MRIARNSKKRSPFVWLQTDEHFRADTVVLGHRGSIFMSILENKWQTYKMVTDQLAAATHKFEVLARDANNNVSGYVAGSVVIPAYTMPPRFIAFVYADRHHVTLSWSEPVTGAPDNYVVYSNGGNGSLDLNKQFDVLAGTVKSVSYNLPTNGLWRLKVEARDGGVESNTNFYVEMIIPRENSVPPSVVDVQEKRILVNAENVSVGRLKITFLWKYGNLAKTFRIYHDNGTGSVDYDSYIEFDRTKGYTQTHTTQQIYFGVEDQTFTFVVRAVSPDGIEEANTVENTVVLDGVAPADIQDLVIGTEF